MRYTARISPSAHTRMRWRGRGRTTASDERDDPVRGTGDLLEPVARGPHEPGPEEEVLGRITGDRELREDDEIGAFAPCVRGSEDLLAVAGEVADDCIELRECDPQGFRLTVTNLVYKYAPAMEITFERRYRCPSANGGFACGSLAAFLDADEVEVTLRLPPLGRPLSVRSDGATVALLEGDAVIAEARPSEVDVEVPKPVSVAQGGGRDDAVRPHRQPRVPRVLRLRHP